MTDPLDVLVGRIREEALAAGSQATVGWEDYNEEAERAVWERYVRELGEALRPLAELVWRGDVGHRPIAVSPDWLKRAAALLSPQKEEK